MTKKSGFILLVLFFLTIGVVWFGQDYQKKQKAELLEINGVSQSDKKESNKKEEDKGATKTKSFEENRDELALIDYLSNVPTDDDNKVVSFYGDFSESDKWLNPVGKYINEQVSSNVTINYVALPDYDSYRLLEERKTATLAEKNPTLVFFQIPVYGDQVRDISLSDSRDYIMENYQAIKQALPESLVIFVTPSPSSSRKEEYNSRTLTYTSYLEAAIEAINEEKLPLFDLHKAYNDEIKATDKTLETTLAEDGRTLNNEGNDIYAALFNEQLTKPVDTTSGK